MRKMIYTPHHASNHLAFLQTEIYDFTHGLVKVTLPPPPIAFRALLTRIHTCIDPQQHCWQDTGRQFDCLLLFRRSFTDVIVISNRGHRLGVFKKWLPGAEELLTTAIGDCPKQGILRSVVPTWAWGLVCRVPNARDRPIRSISFSSPAFLHLTGFLSRRSWLR
ncbi:hypothetical protein FIBSPDRAFT_322622 [Athelia psychrophila]|uniref:Uncharacterized protein n=1 Tax=Athelia psychrophila TaxID=1759441 RepID=A0A166QKC4_9AGAM|nr:hypothetical protein FIBSPDRAFT_322622 [Fibularhizoctonia sp. CBS 109695]